MKTLQDYTKEKLKDSALYDIKMICYEYLENSDLILDILDEHIILCYEMVTNEFNEISNLKNSLKIKDYNSPFYEIYSNLDNLIMAENLLTSDNKMILLEISKDINYLIDVLSFCHFTLFKIIKERNIL